MSNVILIVGSVRSGKSSYAQQLAEQSSERRTYIATAKALDPEMCERIALHQKDRQNRRWKTIEAPVDVAEALLKAPAQSAVVVDCLTLWLNNIMDRAESHGHHLTRDALESAAMAIIEAAGSRTALTVFVTNEVGAGIVPDNVLADGATSFSPGTPTRCS
jgi:adenosylcobinamide kinase/adenosylcobinamide-phosphate guanylyltransferase